MGRVLPAVLVAAFATLSAAPALAANQAVTVADNVFAPGRVGVKPGESVTWTTSGGNPHNVTFDDGSFREPSPARSGPWTATRSFPTEGSYPYYCEIHGGPGGQGMSGVVYVNAAGNAPPTATLTVSPNPAQTGQAVSFSGSGSSDSDGTIAKYEWDLDGNGSFETNTGTTASTSRSYASAGTLTVKLRVTDNTGATDEATRSLRITTPPTASFTVSPNPAEAGQTVSFDGAGSSDSDGTVARYDWDLDGDGSFETRTGSVPTASRTYTNPGAVTVKLRVTDNDGAAGETTRSLQIDARPPSVIPALVTPLPTPASNPLPPSFAASRRSIAVGKSGRFSYSFGAASGLSGEISLQSVSAAAKRRISLGTKRFTVPSSGIVKVSWKLPSKALRTLKRSKRIKFRATVTLRNAAGAASSGGTTLTLKKPAR